MRTTAWSNVGEAVGVGLLLALLPSLAQRHASSRALPLSTTSPVPLLVHSPFEQALRAASWHRMKAKIAVNDDREALEAWDPAAFGDRATGSDDLEAWRLGPMALDRSGDLSRARALALRAAGLARGPVEAYRSAELLVLIEHETGHHDRELDEARLLVKLRPGSERAYAVLRRAEGCRARQPGYTR